MTVRRPASVTLRGSHEIPRNPDLLYILGFDREIENFFQATLPVRCAGLGLRNSYNHSSAAYVASVLSCLDLMLMLIGPENVARVRVEAAERGDSDEAGTGGGGQDDAGGVADGHDPADGDRAEEDLEHGSEAEQDDARDGGEVTVRGDEAAAGGGGQDDAGGVGDGDRAEDDHDDGSEAEQDNTEVIARRLITPTLLSSLSEAAGEVITLADLLAGTNQRTLSQKIDQARLKQLQDSFEDSPRDTARIAALTTPRSREYLNVVPCRDLHMRSDQFSVIVKYQLGANVYEEDFTCPACHQPAGANGDHALVCGVGNGRILRHNSIREVLISVAKSAGLSPVREPRFLIPGVDRRPADLLICSWSPQGLDSLIDVCIGSSLRLDALSRNATDPGTVARMGHERKIQQIGGAVSRLNMEFLPFSMESLGGFTPTAIRIVTKLGRDRAIRDGSEQDRSVDRVFKSISVTLQRCQANMFINRYISLGENTQFNIM